MSTAASEPPAENNPPSVPWSDIVRFVRQLSHDLRNNLNAAELQSAYVNELTSNVELKSEVTHLREMISELGAILQKLSAGVAEIKPDFMPYRAADFMEDLRGKVTSDFPEQAATLNWEIQIGDATLDVDPQLLQQALLELLANAFRHEPAGAACNIAARIEEGRFVFTLHEPKQRFDLPTENWGREPLGKISQGHYGLGLNRVRVIVEAHHGEFRAQYDPKSAVLVTTVTLPLMSNTGG
jgi:two-component system OmpR family sensor kinase